MWTIGWMVPAFVAGYVVSVFTWERVQAVFVDVEKQADAMREKLRELEKRIRG